MASGPATGPLEVALQAHSFPQTGSWSMLDIAKLPVQQVIAVMSRYAAGRVNQYTALVGEALGMTFRMSAGGRARVEQALSKLPAINAMGNILAIGFGIEDVIRVMAKNAGGCMLLGLCAALTDCYSDDVAVEILLEYARATKADSKFMPSNMEWRNLLDACAGSLATSNFSKHAEHFMQLAGDRKLGAYTFGLSMPKQLRGCSLPLSIAQALVALAAISTGEMDSVTIRGGADAGWLVAFADWFLDLRILVMREATNETVFVNFSAPAVVQVRVIYARPPHLDLEPNEPGNVSQTLVHLSERTYHLELQEATKLFLHHNDPSNNHIVAGRLEWKRALRSTFLADFQSLMHISEILADMIGSAARIFQAVASAEPGLPTVYLRANVSYCEAALGSGLIETICNRFPELEKLRSSMEASLSESKRLDDAKKQYETCINRIRTNCACFVCRPSENGFPLPDENVNAEISIETDNDGSNSELSHSGWDPNHFCQVALAETIIVLGRNLANTRVAAEELTPLRSGLELAYGRRLIARTEASWSRQHVKALGQIAFCLDMDHMFKIGKRQDNREGVELRMAEVAELFTGRWPPSTMSRSSAIWINGLTVFSEILLDEGCEQRNHVAQIQVVPGRLQFEGKSYTALTDIALARDNGEVSSPMNVHSLIEKLARSGVGYPKRGLDIREGSINLQCSLKFRAPPDAMITHEGLILPPTIDVGPSQLADLLGRFRGLVSCRSRAGSTCHELPGYSQWPQAIHSPWLTEITMDGKQVLFITSTSSVQALGFIASTVGTHPGYWTYGPGCLTYIVDKECLQCCLKTANAVNRRGRTIFCFIRVA